MLVGCVPYMHASASHTLQDGQPSFCHTYLDDLDLATLRAHVYANCVDPVRE